MNITHRGQILTQQQLDALVPYCNGIMAGDAHNDEAIDRALEAAGCPVAPLGISLAYAVFADNGNVACFSTDAKHHSLVRLQAEGHHIVHLIDRQAYDALQAELQQLRSELDARTALDSLPEDLPEAEMYAKYLPGVIPANADVVNADKDGWNRYRIAALPVFARVCEERDSHQRVAIKTMEQNDALRRAFTRLHHVVAECEQLASRYSGSIDGVEEHGGDDHEDPTCAIWHRLYYAEYDARRALAAPAAPVKP